MWDLQKLARLSVSLRKGFPSKTISQAHSFRINAWNFKIPKENLIERRGTMLL